jgi:hypothetical protein
VWHTPLASSPLGHAPCWPLISPTPPPSPFRLGYHRAHPHLVFFLPQGIDRPKHPKPPPRSGESIYTSHQEQEPFFTLTCARASLPLPHFGELHPRPTSLRFWPPLTLPPPSTVPQETSWTTFDQRPPPPSIESHRPLPLASPR